jgi:hypothetical protein
MVKLGTVQFKGQCNRHPGFDPTDGPGGIRGGCKQCQLLLDIYDAHARLVELIRRVKDDARPALAKRAVAASDDRQISMF